MCVLVCVCTGVCGYTFREHNTEVCLYKDIHIVKLYRHFKGVWGAGEGFSFGCVCVHMCVVEIANYGYE